MDAVRATNSPRVTAADVAAAGGLSLADAKSGVVSLAAALGGETELEVSKTGDLAEKSHRVLRITGGSRRFPILH